MPRPRTDFPKEQFYLWRHDPGKGQREPQEWKLQFEAHIVSINDSSNPTYNEFFDMGRADPKVFYGGANRQYSLNFFLVAFSKEEHDENYQKLLPRLGKMTYPIYSSGQGYSSPQCLMQIGQLFKGYGVITSLTYDWKNDTPWIDNKPLYTDINLTFKVLANSQGYRPDADKAYLF